MPEEHVLDSSVAGSEDDDQADDDALDLSRKPWTKEVTWIGSSARVPPHCAPGAAYCGGRTV